MNPTSAHKTGFLRQEVGTAGERQSDMYRFAERGRGANEVQAHCPRWRGPSDKPWSHRCNTPLNFRIGSHEELVDAVALQTNTRCRSTKLGEIEKTKGTIRAHNFQIVPYKHKVIHQPQVNRGDRASRSTTHLMNPSGPF